MEARTNHPVPSRQTDITMTAIRHAEKRRTATCRFANRVARVSMDHYRRVVPTSYQESQEHTCIATVVLSHKYDHRLKVVAMGVGTKFLTENLILKETCGEECYGERVRDCHAEVLARRAFRRFLSEQLLQCNPKHDSKDDRSDDNLILERIDADEQGRRFRLRNGWHVHFYTSSAPCGNSVLKKFATMKKEVYLEDLQDSEWPCHQHSTMPGHSIPMGQFALLVKKDNSVPEEDLAVDPGTYFRERSLPSKQSKWPIYASVDWCPSGTTTVWSGRGSIHSCR